MFEGIVEVGLRLTVSAVIGAMIGFERRVHHKAIGVAGMLLGLHLSETDQSSVSRALQGFLSGIGFLGGGGGLQERL